MAPSLRSLALLPFLLFSATPVLAQEMETAQPIGNWSAPLLWGASEAAAATPEEQSGSVRFESEAALPTVPLPLIGLTPCRIVDTRGNGFTGAYGPPSLPAATPRNFTLTGRCGIAAAAQAVSLNVTVTNTTGPGFIKIYPQGGVAPVVSTLNYLAGQTVANAAVVPLGTGGGITVVAAVSGTDLILDTNGYYDNSGIITRLNPGTGLTGGGTSGTVSLGIVAGGVTSTELAASSVTSSKIAANAVTAGAIAAGQVGTTHLADGVVGKSKLSATGGTSGQVLITDGSGLLWQAPPGLTLPYKGSFNLNEPNTILSLDNSGTAASVLGSSKGPVAIWGRGGGTSTFVGTWPIGVAGSSAGGTGISGVSDTGTGVFGSGYPALYGYGVPGVLGVPSNGAAASDGVLGDAGYDFNGSATGVHGKSRSADGVRGESVSGNGVYGVSNQGPGVHGRSSSADGLVGEATAVSKSGVFAVNTTAGGYAGYFLGDAHVTGNLSAGGTKPFRIDHPLDPENRELWHAAVESSEVLNVYSGNVVTDAEGRAVVELPAWFEALNTDFRYQLTAVGRFAQAMIEREIEHDRFTIATNPARVKVSWQVTARRNDAWIRAHPFAAERQKPENERGTYLAPLEYGQPEQKSVDWILRPEVMKRLKEPPASVQKSTDPIPLPLQVTSRGMVSPQPLPK